MKKDINVKTSLGLFSVVNQTAEEIEKKCGEAAYGYVDVDDEIIVINKSSNSKQKKITFLHELLHIMLEEHGHNSLSCNEDFVDSLRKELYIILSNNDINKLLESVSK